MAQANKALQKLIKTEPRNGEIGYSAFEVTSMCNFTAKVCVSIPEIIIYYRKRPKESPRTLAKRWTIWHSVARSGQQRMRKVKRCIWPLFTKTRRRSEELLSVCSHICYVNESLVIVKH